MARSNFTRFTNLQKTDSRKRESSKTGESFRQPEKTRRKYRTRKNEEIKGGPEYKVYTLNAVEWLTALAMGAGIAGLAAYICYRSLIAFFIFLIPAAATPYFYREYLLKKRLIKLEEQFKEMIQILSASLSAGFSVENAMIASGRELEMMYGKDGMITKEVEYMVRQMQMNRPIEDLMLDFAVRSGLEEVDNFARIFAIAKRSGGKLVPIIAHTVQVMNDRYRVKEEIRTMTASKQFEQKVMMLMPALIIIYVDYTSPDFFEASYTTLWGRALMSGCLIVYILACYLSSKILDIQV